MTLGYGIGKTGYVFFDAQKSMRPPQSTEIVYGNRLNSEKAWNYEAGARWFPTQRTTLGATFYRIDFQNQINYDSTMVNPLGTAGGYVNLGATRYQGVELTAEWTPKAIPGLSLNGNYSFLDARQKDGAYAGKRVPYTSKHQITGDIRYQRGRTVFDFSGYYFSQSFTDIANTSKENATGSVGRVPGYVVFNTQITHTFYKDAQGLKLDGSLALMNMGNEHYYFRGIDTSPWGRESAPGRTFQVASKVTF